MRVVLGWRPAELYSLVLTHLLNDLNAGEHVRAVLRGAFGYTWAGEHGVYPVPPRLSSDETQLRAVIEGIAGPWMGRDKKRGFTFTWIPTHLADAAGRISPRSFLLAFRDAARHMQTSLEREPRPLHFQAIHAGVTAASRVRIEELKEDYPWVEPLLESARGLSVPFDARELRLRWTEEQLQRVASSSTKLPPRRFTTDPLRQGSSEALIDDLIELAVLYRTADGRLNMPDIFRVAFGIKRKGGVRPIGS